METENETELAQGENKKSNSKKGESVVSSLGFTMWIIVMVIYVLVFGYTGYVAFWPMQFNDPDHTIRKYAQIIQDYDGKEEGYLNPNLELIIEPLMQKAEDTANDMQALASQSFNIVLGAFLAFLSATVTMVFQSRK